MQPFCDAVDLNLGCPQGIARKGHYGAFLQEDIGLIEEMIRTLHTELEVPVTAKIRILDTKEQTLEYARRVVNAGASILTVHGRRRECKGHKTGLADWRIIRYLKENLPRETVVFANGNVLCHEDLERCLEETGVDGVMSAEGNLCDPGIFAEPPEIGQEGRMYWRGKDGRGGWRMDEVFRRYMDIIYKYVLEMEPPVRKPLYIPSDPTPSAAPTPASPSIITNHSTNTLASELTNNKRKLVEDTPPSQQQHKKQKPNTNNSTKSNQKRERPTNPSLLAMQAHLFHLLRPLVARHTNIRDTLAKSRAGNLEAFENVLQMVEGVVAEGMRRYAETGGESWAGEERGLEGKLLRTLAGGDEVEGKVGMEGEGKRGEKGDGGENGNEEEYESSIDTVRKCRRPWWVVQPYVRPLPKEALAKGSWKLSKKERRGREVEEKEREREKEVRSQNGEVGRDGLGMELVREEETVVLEGFVEKERLGDEKGERRLRLMCRGRG